MVRTDGQAARPELPPRARRILHGRGRGAYVIGTTSACAENTAPCPGRQSLWRNYLRVRGEYRSSCYAGVDELELPPRARRIPTKTLTGYGPSRNYLRVRGEYMAKTRRTSTGAELPPRARRIRKRFSHLPDRGGTTSACAENTHHASTIPKSGANYLRVRGEYSGFSSLFDAMGELPPRARRIPNKHCIGVLGKGTTSACAENTPA